MDLGLLKAHYYSSHLFAGDTSVAAPLGERVDSPTVIGNAGIEEPTPSESVREEGHSPADTPSPTPPAAAIAVPLEESEGEKEATAVAGGDLRNGDVVADGDLEEAKRPSYLPPEEESLHGILKQVPSKEGEGAGEIEEVVEEVPFKKTNGKK